MSDAPKSPLAQKALAQKAARDKAAADAEAEITGARTRKQVLAEIWAVIRVNYVAAVQSLNKDLEGTGTSLRLDARDNTKLHLIGFLTVSVVNNDVPTFAQTHYVEMGNSGRVVFKDHFKAGENFEEHGFDGGEAGTDWVHPTLEAFVDRALT